MWRNIFGHGIYQIIVLVVLLFAAEPTNMVHNYTSSCLKYTTDANNKQICANATNPYYSNILYMNDIEQKWWKDQNLNSWNFDQTALKAYSCEQYVW